MKLYKTLRHPLTGARFRVRGRTDRELEALVHRVDTLRSELRLGMVTSDYVDQALRRLRFGASTVAKAANSYAERPDLSMATRRRVRSSMAGVLAPLSAVELEALDGPRLAKHFESLASRMAASSVTQAWRTLRAIVRHAAERGWIARVPWGGWRPRAGRGGAGRPLRDCARSEAELEAILSAARRLDAEGPYRALEAKIGAAAHLGLRQGELAGLRWRDVDWIRLEVAIVRQWAGAPIKSASSGVLHASGALFAALAAHATRVDDAADAPVFPRADGRPYTSGECLSSPDLRAVVDAAGLESRGWSPHSLRDTFATLESQRSGGDLRRVQGRTRHKTLASLVRYLKRFQREPMARALPASAEAVT